MMSPKNRRKSVVESLTGVVGFREIFQHRMETIPQRDVVRYYCCRHFGIDWVGNGGEGMMGRELSRVGNDGEGIMRVGICTG